jgi:subtilisin
MTKLRFAPGVPASALALLLLSGSGQALFAQDSGTYIVQFRAHVVPAARRAAVEHAAATVGVVYSGISAASVRVPNERALRALQRHPDVVSVTPDRAVFADQNVAGKGGGSNKPGGGVQAQVIPAGVARVRASQPGSDGSGIGVAVLDTGVDLSHPDLVGTADAFSAFGPSCMDDNGHGTHVAGIIAARNNTIDVVGVAPAARVYCVKVLDGSGSGSDESLMAGLDWVLSNHALVQPAIRVINMSLGRPGTVDDNPAMRDLVAALEAAGVSIIASAGNDAAADVSGQIPAAYPQVAAVASTTAVGGSNQCRFLSGPVMADTASYFTTDGAQVLISAPGEEREDVSRSCLIQSVGILSTRLGGGTTRMSGTSMASPHVAGVAARYYQQNPSYSPSDVRGWIAADAARPGVAPLNSPGSGYTFDGVREGIAQAPPAP